MMEASVVTQDSGHTTPLTAALDASPLPSSSPAPPPDSVPPSPPAPSQPPARPRRPKPPPPSLKSCRPPLPPSAPPSLPPPLPPVSKPLFPPPPGLPPPLSPTPASPSPSISPQPAVSSELTPTFSPPPLPPPLSPTVPSSSCSTPPPPPPSLVPPSSPTPPPLSPIDRVVGSAPVWRLKGLSQEQTTVLLGKETPGVFVVLGSDDDGMKLLLRQPEGDGTPPVHELDVKRHKTFVHLDGSCLVFDDIFKMICFYSVSRDVLAVPLRLPMAITTATKREELEVISAMGADFWTSDMNQQAKDQDPVSDQDYGGLYLHLDPVLVEEKLKPSQPAKSISKPETTRPETTTPQTASSSLQNGEPPQQPTPEVKGQTKTVPHPDIKYKRPPPRRPPSLSSGSGMGLLFSSPPPVHSGSSSADRKEEGKGGAGVEREERKSASVSPPPSRPPVPPQGRAGPPLPPAPLRRTSSRTGSDKEGTEREKGRDSARKNENEAEGGEETGSRSALTGEGGGGGKSKEEEEEARKEKEGEEEEEKQKAAKKPSRPVPPPRRKPCGPNQPAGSIHQGPAARGAAAVAAAAPPPRRPDVSLYSPQGGAVLGTDPDSCSTSSTEEEGEVNQEQEQNHTRPAESKVTVKRTPTTVMLDRARYRLSTVLTGLISHDRRLTQRIVEVARDPLSYFGNLVKEHRAFTLETMSNHATSTELLQEIRQMMTQLKSYLLQSTELQAMLEPQHQYTQDKLENIVEAALCKSVLKPLREPIYQSLEKLHANNSGLKQLAQNQSVVLGSTTTALGITTAVPEASAMEKISIKLNNLHLEYSPQKKIELLLKACKIIYDSMSVSSPGRSHGADDFLPVMMYVLARSNLSDLQLDVEYMMELMDPALTLGEGSYYLTTTYGALEHIKTFDQQRTATRQLSREVQDSIHRWERRRTLNQERMSQGSVRDFLTVCCPEIGTNPKTLGVLPTTTIQQLTEQCAARFEQDSYVLSLYMDDVHQPLAPTEMALSVKSSCQPGSYCFVFHPVDRPSVPPVRSCPTDPPPAPPTHVCYQPVAEATAAIADDDAAEEEPVAEAEDSLISL